MTEFLKNGIRGPCNWYRTRRVNYEDELAIPQSQRKVSKSRDEDFYVFSTSLDHLNAIALNPHGIVPGQHTITSHLSYHALDPAKRSR